MPQFAFGVLLLGASCACASRLPSVPANASTDMPRKSFGRFGFTLDMLDTPPIFVRAYRLRVPSRIR